MPLPATKNNSLIFPNMHVIYIIFLFHIFLSFWISGLELVEVSDTTMPEGKLWAPDATYVPPSSDRAHLILCRVFFVVVVLDKSDCA